MSQVIAASGVKRLGREAGFDLVGIVSLAGTQQTALSAILLEDFKRYGAWLERGFHGTMEYLVRGAEPRRDPRALLPEGRSVIVCALGYLAPESFNAGPSRSTIRNPQSEIPLRQGYGGQVRNPKSEALLVSRYALGDDYHRVVRRRLTILLRKIEERLGRAVGTRLCVDTAPVLERALARLAGIGWIGKNNCLIHPTFGSFLFLGELFVDLDLPPDRPLADRCGRCERCLSACPTHALVEPRRLDARRCIAYLTIEHRGPMDPALAGRLGRRVYGCDTCQEVCPWNQRAQRRVASTVRELWPAPHLVQALASDFELADEAEFRAFFRNSVIRRLGLETWRRNLHGARRQS